MKTFVVLIPVSDSLVDPRKACEQIEDMKFEMQTPNAYNVLKKLMFEFGVSDSHNIEVEPITDFMDRFNNEELNPDNYFMSYVHVK